MMTLMDEGNKARTVAATAMNETCVPPPAPLSSRAELAQLVPVSCSLYSPAHHEATRRPDGSGHRKGLPHIVRRPDLNLHRYRLLNDLAVWSISPVPSVQTRRVPRDSVSRKAQTSISPSPPSERSFRPSRWRARAVEARARRRPKSSCRIVIPCVQHFCAVTRLWLIVGLVGLDVAAQG